MKSKIAILLASLCLTIVTLGCGGYGNSNTPAPTSSSGFQQTNLVSDTTGTAGHKDAGLINPWGIAFIPNQSFWIAENNSGRAKIFDPAGVAQVPTAINIPTPANTASKPTGIVFNPIAEDFKVSDTPAQFLFATEDGTVSTWSEINGNLPAAATLAVNDSGVGAVYKGLAILNPECCREFLALADFHNGSIATYSIRFELLAPLGTFTDPNLPDGYAPFNIQQIGSQVFVTYAKQDDAKHDPVRGAGNGIVNIFDQEGNLIRRFASNGPLNAPWGVTKTPANFGPFHNAVLIGNFGDGTINAYDFATGDFLGSLKDKTGNAITNPGLWGLTFRTDNIGDPNTLYITAGSTDENHGLFAAISFHN